MEKLTTGNSIKLTDEILDTLMRRDMRLYMNVMDRLRNCNKRITKENLNEEFEKMLVTMNIDITTILPELAQKQDNGAIETLSSVRDNTHRTLENR